MKKQVLWDDAAKVAFKARIQYIKQDSPQGAQSVRLQINNAVDGLLNQPFKYPADRYRKEVNISYRAFELCHLRISYFVGKDYIRVIRVRHTSQAPLEY